MTPRAVLLDAGNTLMTERLTRDQIYTRVLRAWDPAVDEAAVGELRERLHRTMPGDVDGHAPYTDVWFREFMRRLLGELAIDADAELVRRTTASHFERAESFRLYDDAIPALTDLRERGLRLAVVSNWSDRLPGLLAGLGVTPLVDAVVVSAIEGHTKPDPRLFACALERLGVAPSEALHVGDHPVNDVEGARAAGVRALLLDRDRRHPGRADVVTDLHAVSRHLARRGV